MNVNFRDLIRVVLAGSTVMAVCAVALVPVATGSLVAGSAALGVYVLTA